MRIYLIGFMGCGKTHWAKLLSQKLKLPLFDLDEQIVASEGKSINDIFADEGEEYFRLREKEILYILTESHDSFIMATGGGTPCYYNNIDYMKKSGIPVWINSSIDSLFNRLAKEREHRPLLRDLSDDQLRGYIIKKFADRKIFYQQASVIISEEEATLEKIIDKIFHA
ncbi:shikimate kinase [Paraflavisolibacter sp. H34]|uniref:shikimate kinase n=1 Tax=Huijunlia imazamoxiresistens TaxID=3127457 RepID=UPI003017C321